MARPVKNLSDQPQTIEPATDYEEAVSAIRALPDCRQLIHDAYLDEDPVEACERFAASDEFTAVAHLLDLDRRRGQRLLDLGAGNGIASLAFACRGLRVVAVEPGRGSSVGAPAIRSAGRRKQVTVGICASHGERLALRDRAVDVIYARQVLHHATDLPATLRECARVMRSGGTLLAAREPVVDNASQLKEFLFQHPLSRRGVHEHAWPLRTYLAALRGAGLQVTATIGPWQSVVNYAPLSEPQIAAQGLAWARRWLGPMAANPWAHTLWPRLYRWRLGLVRTPGRLYTFLAQKA